MTTHYLNLQITRSDIRPQIKWVASLVIAYGHFSLPQALCGYVMYGLTLTLSPQRGRFEMMQILASISSDLCIVCFSGEDHVSRQGLARSV